MAFTRHFEFRAVSRWGGLCLIVGTASGLMAVVLFAAVEAIRHFLLVQLAGVSLLEAKGEPALFANHAHGPYRPWVLVLVPTLGGLVTGLLLHYLGRDARGGTDGYVAAFHQSQGRIRRRLPWLKLAASSVFLGSGASAGREGPIAHIGAGLGALVGRMFRLSDRERRLLLVAGAAGGIGAIFRTPLGGALFAVEVLYRDDIEVDALVPAVLSSVVAYSVFTMIFGEGTMFLVASEYPFDPRQLPLYLVMAVGAALVGVAFVALNRRAERLFAGLELWFPLKPALGGLGVGLLALWMPQALGSGYGWLQEAMAPSGRLHAGWWGTMLLIVLVKVLSTTMSHAAGGAGGVFGPSVVIGGLLGGAFGLAFHQWFPGVVPEPTAFVIVGMASFVGGVTHAPVATLVMASEMTGSYELLVPIMMTEVVTVTLMRRFVFYPQQVPTRRDSAAHSGEYARDVLQDILVKDVVVLGRALRTVLPSTPLAKLLRDVAGDAQSVFPVIDEAGTVSGVIPLEVLRAYTYDEEMGAFAIAADCAMPYVHVRPEDSLAVALERFAATHYPELPVVTADDPAKIIALLSYDEVLTAYSRDLLRRRIEERPQ